MARAPASVKPRSILRRPAAAPGVGMKLIDDTSPDRPEATRRMPVSNPVTPGSGSAMTMTRFFSSVGAVKWMPPINPSAGRFKPIRIPVSDTGKLPNLS